MKRKPLKVKVSSRHKIVEKLVLTSLTITSIFGINSFFFSFSQNKLSDNIKHIEALDALKISTATDKISVIAELETNYSNCLSKFPTNCESYFTALIQTRNRVKDYEITFAETLQIDKKEAVFQYLSSIYNNTDKVANQSFDMSFGDAKKEKISTAAEYIQKIINKDYSISKYKTSNKELLKSIDIFYESVNQWIEKEFISRKTIPEIMSNVNIAYLILISTEIILFLLVSSIDIINNNVSSQKEVVN